MSENYNLKTYSEEQSESFIKPKENWAKPKITDLNINQTLDGPDSSATEQLLGNLAS